jgi:hypothetical protein
MPLTCLAGLGQTRYGHQLGQSLDGPRITLRNTNHSTEIFGKEEKGSNTVYVCACAVYTRKHTQPQVHANTYQDDSLLGYSTM